MLRRLVSWLLIALFTAAAGCGGGHGGSGRGSPTTSGGEAKVSVASASTGLPTSTSTTAALFEFVDYRVSGGVAGVQDDLKVYPDGRASYHGAGAVKELSIPANTVAELRTALEQANLASLPAVNGTVTPDVQQYNVIFGGRSVRFVDGAMPAPLAPAVAILNRELARARAGR